MADMGKLAMRLQSLAAADRRTFLEAMLATLAAGNLKFLVEFFKSDPLLNEIAAEPDWGPLKAIEEIVKNYAAVSEIDKELARQLLDRFLSYFFTHREEIGINNVFVWLQPLARFQLLNDAVELVASRQWVPAGADPTEIRRFELMCRRSRASLFRRQRRYAEADEELHQLIDEWRSFDPREVQELSILEYELGYSAYLQGRVDEAARVFFDGSRHAAVAKDRVGELINSFCGYYTQFHGRVIDSHEARRQFQRHYRDLLDQPRQKRVDAWLSTIQHRLFEVACSLGDAEEAFQFAARLKTDDYLKSLVEDVHSRFSARKVLALAAVVRRDWKTALHHFGSFLDADLSNWGAADPELASSVRDDWDELAICYREAGIAAKELGESEVACRIWERGLALPASSGNTFFQNDIRSFLAKHRKVGQN